MKKLVEQRNKELGLSEVNVEDVVNVVGEVKEGKMSKSKGMLYLYDLGYDVVDVRDTLLEGEVNVSYHFCYNVISNNRVMRVGEKKPSKSAAIRELYNQGKSVSEIGEELVNQGFGYTNSNFITSVTRKERMKTKK